MDGVQGLTRIVSSPQVKERNAGGNKQQADAFNQAMQERGSEDGAAMEREPEQPVRRALQQRGRISRNDEGQAMHVDVIA